MGKEDKEFFGFVPSPAPPPTPCPLGRLASPMESPGSVVRKRLEKLRGMNTGNSWSPSPRRSLLEDFKKCLEPEDTMNSPDQKRPPSMYGKKQPELKEHSLNMEQSLLEETQEPTGSMYGKLPSPENLMMFPQMYEWSLTGPYDQLLQTMLDQDLLCVLSLYSGVFPALVNLAEPGMKPAWTLILKILGPNFGAAIKVKQMLCWMNFEEELISVIYSDGLIGIRSVWKSKVEVDLS